VTKSIELRGVRVNNLKNIDIDIPLGKLVALCGVSGSGKTSLAFDTLYAEGQRRFISSFSAYTRQYLEKIEKPDVDRISNIPPALSVKAHTGRSNRRSTVGTGSEVIDYLRILFASLASPFCCGTSVSSYSVDSVAQFVTELEPQTRVMIGFERRFAGGERQSELESLMQSGFHRGVYQGKTVKFDQADAALKNGEKEEANCVEDDSIYVIVDRLKSNGANEKRTMDSLETSFEFGDQRCVVIVENPHRVDGGIKGHTLNIDGIPWIVFGFTSFLECTVCHTTFPEPTAELFSFNNSKGACPECEGFGMSPFYDIEKIVPDTKQTIRQGAIAPWQSPAYAHEQEELEALADEYKIDLDRQFCDLSTKTVKLLWNGVPERNFGGLDGFFRWLEKRRYKMHLRVFASRFKSYQLCASCEGNRLNEKSSKFRIHVDGQNRSISEICQLSISAANDFAEQCVSEIKSNPNQDGQSDSRNDPGQSVWRQLRTRLAYLNRIGLGYLTLDRPLGTLSRGESQRVRLTNALGSDLVNTLYVLDEPSTGLHQENLESLNQCLRQLCERGNSVVMVEHQRRVLNEADELIEMGEDAGELGGEIVFQGRPEKLARKKNSVTGQFLSGQRGNPPDLHRETSRGSLKLINARGLNLKNITVEFPLNCLCVVSGVSGSGKSALVQETLCPALGVSGKVNETATMPFEDLVGAGQFDEVVAIDHTVTGKNSRSNPITYLKAYDEIRKLLADTADAKVRGLKPGSFSFNVDGGRCTHCQGDGTLQVDMHFLPDVIVTCQHCKGQRFRAEVLDVGYRGKNIAEILGLSVREAFSFFRGQPKIQARLKPLMDTGIGYLRLGQSTSTLSNGELQRLKMAQHLLASKRGRTLFVLDEPTTGLHPADVVKLLSCFDALLNVGHSLIVVEHNLQLIQSADWIIDLGPGAAEEGGNVVAVGTPQEVAQCGESVTGKYLKAAFKTATS